MKYLLLGFGIANAVLSLLAIVRVPSLLSAAGVWQVVQPVLVEIQDAAGVKINMPLALQITTDAVDTIQAALKKGA